MRVASSSNISAWVVLSKYAIGPSCSISCVVSSPSGPLIGMYLESLPLDCISRRALVVFGDSPKSLPALDECFRSPHKMILF